METWFLNHVLGLSLSVLLLGLPGPLGAGTPSNNSTDPVTAGFYVSTATDELSNKENNATSTIYSSESLSPSQRNILLTHVAETHTAAAGNFDTEQTQTFTETSSQSQEPISLSTEPLTSDPVVVTTEASSSRTWKDFTNTDQVPNASLAVSWGEVSSWMSTEDDRLPRDSPDTTLRLGDASSVHTDSTYTSTTISRAGERTLLSVTSSTGNSTSSFFTEDSNSHQPSSYGEISAKTEDYTHNGPSTMTESGDTTDQHMTRSFQGMFSETGGPRGIKSLNRQPNATENQQNSTSEDTSDSTPPLRVTEPSTDQSEVSVSSTPPLTSPAEGLRNISGTDQGASSSLQTSTESSNEAQSSSTQNQEGTDGVSSQTWEQSVSWGLTTASPAVSRSTSEMDDSLTETMLVTEALFTTTPVTATDRSHMTEEDTFKATASTAATTTTPTPPPPATSSFKFISTTSSSTPESPTQATIPHTTLPTTASTQSPSTTAVHRTHNLSPSHTQRPSTGMVNPTKITTMRAETSTVTMGVTTTNGQHITTTFTHGTPTRSTEALQTTGRRAGSGHTELVTTSPTSFSTTEVPPPAKNPCVSNPCMNGGTCVSNKGHQFNCHCQQAWTGPTCNQYMNECERDPCPVGSRCVNTQGSFSCECPLGFDLEDGRTCTRAKTFLGTFSVNRPRDTAVLKSGTLLEIQKEIIRLLNASLSVLRGYSRSTLSRKGDDGDRISAVNMFSISTDVTSAEVYNRIQMFLSNCSTSLAHCHMVLHGQLTYREENLCVAQKTQCDTERSTCTYNSGMAYCQCLQGYYKHNPEDLSCLECGDGYKLENGTCVPCMFGFGGFNCGNFYKLIAVVVSPAGGGLLLILVIALIVTCCRRDKNDINKIIFKSGDLQMSPYADFPKNNRISMEWGRETIEMQENGSTKNLLQMTDIYYSPALRNSDLERNGLYPFTGLPGSRHSCIYPAQWNPSFISDDSRRRDYF